MAIDGSEAMKKVNTTQFIFMNHTIELGGLLPNDTRAHACWYYCRLATLHMIAVDGGAAYVGQLDMVNLLNNLARSVCMIYKLDSPDEFLKFMHHCKAEVQRENGTWDHRIERPDIQPFRSEVN